MKTLSYFWLKSVRFFYNNYCTFRKRFNYTCHRQSGYACTFDDIVNDDDLVLNYQVQDKIFDVLIDSMSFQYINGAFLDCKTHEGKEGLLISNPNAGKVKGENEV